MEIKSYLVGGAVRDGLLGRPVVDRDWVVVGSSLDQLLAEGYQQIDNDFPCFLHPETKEEYALARTERKSGTGHTSVCRQNLLGSILENLRGNFLHLLY